MSEHVFDIKNYSQVGPLLRGLEGMDINSFNQALADLEKSGNFSTEVLKDITEMYFRKNPQADSMLSKYPNLYQAGPQPLADDTTIDPSGTKPIGYDENVTDFISYADNLFYVK